MANRTWWAWGILLAAFPTAAPSIAQEAPAQAPMPPAEAPARAEDLPAPKSAPSKVSSVIVYRGNALVTREVAVPEGRGRIEVVVSPLPPATIDSTLYTEGGEGIRILSTRFRTRAVKEDSRQEVRTLEDQLKKQQAEVQQVQKDLWAVEQDAQFVHKLENFTTATLHSLTDKGALDSQATIDLSKYIMASRASKAKDEVGLRQRQAAAIEAAKYTERQLAELTSGSSRTVIDAVIVMDKTAAEPGTARLNYLVGSATWLPQYRLRAGADKDLVQLEYLAAIEQQTGEEWTDVGVTLSTARPMLNAAPPALMPLDVAVAGSAETGEPQAPAPKQGMGGMGGGMGGMGGMMGGGPLEQYRAQASAVRGQAQQQMIGRNAEAGGALLNEAAAIDQTQELLAEDEHKAPDQATRSSSEGPSVTYHLKSRLSVPSRSDQHLVEVARIELKPDYFDKAVPVLTPLVYRLANLVNTSEYVILPGEATMYVGSDFVGRMSLPLVAMGAPFTVGFGVDSQVEIGRRLVSKTRVIQGGNQVHNYEFRIAVRSYRTTPVKLQVWDRLPRPGGEALGVKLEEVTPDISADPLYVRTGKADNLLRWDLDVPPGTTGEKALALVYKFRMEYAREASIAQFQSGGKKVEGLMEAPIGGMGGMGGGFR